MLQCCLVSGCKVKAQVVEPTSSVANFAFVGGGVGNGGDLAVGEAGGVEDHCGGWRMGNSLAEVILAVWAVGGGGIGLWALS